MRKPFVVLCSFLTIGIVVGYIMDHSISQWVFWTALAASIVGMILWEKYSSLCMCFFLILSGSLIYQFYIDSGSVLSDCPLNSFVLEVEILKEPVERFGYLEYDVSIVHCFIQDGKVNLKEKAKLYLTGCQYDPKRYEPGSSIILKSAVLKDDLSDSRRESYSFYLKSKGYQCVIQAGVEDVIEIREKDFFNPIYFSYQVRKRIETFFDRSLQSIQSSLLKSIIFGNQGYMPKEMTYHFSRSGTAHIIAVSGLHIGLVALLIQKVLQTFNVSRKKTLIFTMMVLLFYGYLVHFPVSIVRASLMYYLYVFAYFLDRQYDSVNSLMFVAFLVLIYNPLNLFSVSFQLSFTATLSILLFYPVIKEMVKKLPDFFSSLFSVTIAAQLGTIPIIAYHFHQISMISIIANLLIVPVLGTIIFLAFISMLVSCISFRFGYIINYITNGLLSYIYWIVRSLSHFPFSSISVEKVTWVHITIYYWLLLIFYWSIYIRKQKGTYKRELVET